MICILGSEAQDLVGREWPGRTAVFHRHQQRPDFFPRTVREGTVPFLRWGRIRIEDAKISERELSHSGAWRCRLPAPRPLTRAGCPAARNCCTFAKPCSTARSRSRINAPDGDGSLAVAGAKRSKCNGPTTASPSTGAHNRPGALLVQVGVNTRIIPMSSPPRRYFQKNSLFFRRLRRSHQI